MVQQLFFGYIAAAILVLAGLVVTRRNPVHSALFMLVMFFHVAGLYLLLDAEFMAAIQIIVYAGAIMVLFLFVILLLNLPEEISDKRYTGLWPLGFLLAAGITVVILTAQQSFTLGPIGQFSDEAIAKETHVAAIGKTLYTQYLLPFEVASIILLVAVVGAIVLAKRRI